MQIAPAPEVSTVKAVAAASDMPPGYGLAKSHWIDVFAAIAIGPIRAVVTPTPFLPAPMVTDIALAPLLIVRWSMIIEVPAAGAAFNSSHPDASADTALITHPYFCLLYTSPSPRD